MLEKKNPFLSADGGRALLVWGLAFALVVNLALNFLPGSAACLVFAGVFKKNFPPAAFCAGIDRLAQSMPSEGNIFLAFEGFSRDSAGDDAPGKSSGRTLLGKMASLFEETNKFEATDTAALMYYRFGYKLAPRRVYVVDDDKVVANGRQIVEERFRPGAGWLEAHRVRAMVTISRDGKGEVRFSVERL